jgi:hypothetical protein
MRIEKMLDEMYVKMVLALPEDFFKDWKWEEGDQFLTFYDEEWHVNFVGSNEIHNNKIGTWRPAWGDDVSFFVNRDPKIPLPNQKQLQEISGLDWDLYYHDLVKNYSEYDSAEQAGLARVMYVKYHKKWDGEKWV